MVFSEYLKTVMLGTILVKEVFVLTKKGTNCAKYKENKPSYRKPNMSWVPTVIRNLLNLQ